MLPGLLVGVSLARSSFHLTFPPALSTDDAEVLRSFFRIQQIVNKINIAGFLSESPDATSDADTSSENLNKRMTQSKTETSEKEENTEGPDEGTSASLGENEEFLEDKGLKNPTTTMPTVETEETTTDPYDYDFSHTYHPMYPVDYYYYSDTDMGSDKTEMYDLPEQHPTELSTPAEELGTVGGDANAEDEIVSNSQDVDSEETSGANSGPELTLKENSGQAFKIALLALK